MKTNENSINPYRFNVHFARMGEPTWNDNVALRGVVKSAGLIAVHPVVSTMLPKANNKLGNFLQVWCSIKNEFYNGEAGLQFNSTDDEQRNELSKSLSLAQISRLADELPMPESIL